MPRKNKYRHLRLENNPRLSLLRRRKEQKGVVPVLCDKYPKIIGSSAAPKKIGRAAEPKKKWNEYPFPVHIRRRLEFRSRNVTVRSKTAVDLDLISLGFAKKHYALHVGLRLTLKGRNTLEKLKEQKYV